MTAVPQRTALSHSFGALAAGLVGTAEYYLRKPDLDTTTMVTLGLEVVLGFLTFTGSLMAAGKLQGIVRDRPWIYAGQNLVNLGILASALVLVGFLVADPSRSYLFPLIVAISLLYGVILVIRIGGADMPTVISLLNSFAGLSASMMGFVLDNKLLIIAGALDGTSGLILSIIMCKAMNRSFANVLFGGFGAEDTTGLGMEARHVRSVDPEETAFLLDAARRVVVVPGYGMAAAQAQHKVRVGTKGLIGCDTHAGSSTILPVEARKEWQAKPPANPIPRVNGGPFREWMNAIKQTGPEPGSNFTYSAKLTEIILLGVLAQRFNTRIEWDAKAGRISNHPELNAFVKEPAREGWRYGENL